MTQLSILSGLTFTLGLQLAYTMLNRFVHYNLLLPGGNAIVEGWSGDTGYSSFKSLIYVKATPIGCPIRVR